MIERIFRMFARRAAMQGIKKGVRAMEQRADQNGDRPKQKLTPEERAARKSQRQAMKAARRASNMARRMNRF